MNDNLLDELLKAIDDLKYDLDEGNIDVYGFYTGVIDMTDYIKNHIQ